MTIAESLYFVYDGVRSDEMGLINVNLQVGMQDETFLPEQTIKEVTIRGRDTPYFIEVEQKPFTISLSFAFENNFDDEQLFKVANWLGNQPYYKPLYFSDNIDKWYYVLYTGSANLLHNTLKQGYIQFQMRSLSPYTYSPVYESNIYDLSANAFGGTEIILENKGNKICKPVTVIEKVGNGSIKIVNMSNRGNTFEVLNLVNNEIITIDSDKEDIVSDIPLTYHFDNSFGIFPYFVPGMNYLLVHGNCKIKFKYQFINIG